MRTVKLVQINDIIKHANAISSHVLYKLKTLNFATLIMKALIAPGGNDYSLKLDLKSYCSMFSPVYICIYWRKRRYLAGGYQFGMINLPFSKPVLLLEM